MQEKTEEQELTSEEKEKKDQEAAEKLKQSPYLWITGLKADAKANTLRATFQEAEIKGTIKNIKVAVSKKVGSATAFAFVEMDSSQGCILRSIII